MAQRGSDFAPRSSWQLYKVCFQQLYCTNLLRPRDYSAVGQPLRKHFLPPVRSLQQRARKIIVRGCDLRCKSSVGVGADRERVRALVVERQRGPVPLRDSVQGFVGRFFCFKHHVPGRVCVTQRRGDGRCCVVGIGALTCLWGWSKGRGDANQACFKMKSDHATAWK